MPVAAKPMKFVKTPMLFLKPDRSRTRPFWVPAIGRVAYHRPLETDADGKDVLGESDWSVSHVEIGLAFKTRVSLKAAKAIVRMLNERYGSVIAKCHTNTDFSNLPDVVTTPMLNAINEIARDLV